VGVIRSRLSLLNPGAGQGSDWIVGHGERMVSQCGQHPKRLKALSMTGRKRHEREVGGRYGSSLCGCSSSAMVLHEAIGCVF